MKLNEILQTYQVDSLESLARNKIQDIEHIKLPKEVLIEELCSFILRYPHIERTVALRNPPSYLILIKLIESPGYKTPVQSFKDIIKSETAKLIERATKGEGLKLKKDYSIYLKMLQIAWESENSIDASEARLLMGLREEMDISFSEHIILEHHESLTTYWHSDNYYERERNHLIASGIIFPYDRYFIIPEDAVPLIRRVWGYSLTNDQYNRLLNNLTGQELYDILKKCELQTSGTIDEKTGRIIDNYISPRKTLNYLGIDSLREIVRKIGGPVSGSKNDLIENIIDMLDDDEDLRLKAEKEKKLAPPVAEPKLLSRAAFLRIFSCLSNDQIYSIVVGLRKVRKSGNKDVKIDNLWQSIYSENTLLNRMTNSELYDLCAKLGLKVAGSKQERVDRIISSHKNYTPIQESEEIEKTSDELIRQSTRIEIKEMPDQVIEGLDSLAKKYPFLSREELIILSFIIENKNASGPIIERIVARFDIPWYFPEKQMSEMVDKLKTNGHNIISIHQYGDHALYQMI